MDRSSGEPKDYFVKRGGVVFAGTHLLIDVWGATNLCDPEYIDRALREMAHASEATVLHGHFHHFSLNGGVSGVLVLAESHISIHTWPERNFAAIDVFMCGACNPCAGLQALRVAFQPKGGTLSLVLKEERRGLLSEA
ncbi:MAG: adenosylmethionine decarboxylase [bacterium]